METLTLKAKERQVFGKKLKKFRKQGQVPAILYGHNVKPLPLAVDCREFERIFKKAGLSTLINLELEKGKNRKVLIHQIQKDPVTDHLLHIDFYQVKMTEKITAEIPLKIIGQAPVVEEQGGTLITPRDSIEVECLPEALVREIVVDISNLKSFEDVVKIADLKIPTGLKILNDPEEIVVSVTPPRSEEELAELEAPAEEKVEEVEEVKEAKKITEGEEPEEEEAEETEKIQEKNQ